MLGAAAIALVWLASATPAGAVDSEAREYALGEICDLFEDPSGRLGIDDVTTPEVAQRFQPMGVSYLGKGYTKSAFWLRCDLKLEGPASQTWILETPSILDRLTLYVARPGAVDSPRTLSTFAPFGSREIAQRNLAFFVTLNPGEPTRLYLQLATRHSIQLLPMLWSQRGMVDHVRRETTFNGLFLGALLALILYNLAVYVWTRERTYLWYVAFQCAFVALQATGQQLGAQYVWPNDGSLTFRMIAVFSGLVVLFGLRFANRFLDLDSSPGLTKRFIQAFTYLGIVVTVVSLALPSPPVMAATIYTLVASFLGLVFALDALRRGNRNARFFVVAWTVLLVGVTLDRGVSLGWIAVPFQVYDKASRVGSLVEAILLSFGLAHRLRSMQDELLRSRSELTETLQRKVAERTAALEGAVSDLKSAQARMVQQARLASLGHLVAGVAHEIANPLNVMTSGVSALESSLGKPASEAKAKEAVALLGIGTRRIQNVVESLRRTLLGRPAEMESCDLREGVLSTATLLKELFATRGISLEVAMDGIPPVKGSPGQLNQVFMNLMVNAIQAMPDGGVIRIEGSAPEGRVEVRVSDTGPGIAPEHRDSVFDAFFTTRPPNEGTGLGLTICHQIVEDHGGSIRLEGSERGARFVVTLPRQR